MVHDFLDNNCKGHGAIIALTLSNEWTRPASEIHQGLLDGLFGLTCPSLVIDLVSTFLQLPFVSASWSV
jgi:hypothetical protein